MVDVKVRPAGLADVDEIARIQLATWRAAYSTIVPGHVLEELTEDDVAASWSAAVSNPPSPRHRVLVAMERDATVGFVAFGPAEDEGLDPADTGLVTTMLVEPRWGRRGHGSRLLAATIDVLRDDGCTTAMTWVFERDPASRKFYASAGWGADGATRALDMDGRFVDELRLHTSLADDPPAG